MVSSLRDLDILRLVWAYLGHYFERRKIGFIFGCTSFEGIDHGKYIDCFAILRERYLGPKKLLPSVKSPSVLKFSKALRPGINFKIAMLKMPSLLRAYLSTGGVGKRPCSYRLQAKDASCFYRHRGEYNTT